MTKLGWTEEDQQIWRDRKMPAHTIEYRYQHHMREAALMRKLSMVPIKPSHAKFIAAQFITIKYD